MSANNEGMRALIREFTIRVLLPPVQLVVTCQRDTFLEATLRVCRPSNGESLKLHTTIRIQYHTHLENTDLKTQRHIEVLRHVRLRPDLLLVIVPTVLERRVLECRPAKERVVPHKRRDFPICACHRNTLVDTPGKVRDTILEVVMGDLHNIYGGCEYA